MSLDKDWMTLPDGSKVPRPKEVIHLDQPAQQPSIADVIDNILDRELQVYTLHTTKERNQAKAALLAAFRSLAVAAAPEKKHHSESDRNIAYREGFNDSVDQYQANILAELENKS
jgi:hypothetical protein